MEENRINTKKLAAEKAVEFVRPGMTVGLGTGSTAYWAIQLIGGMVKDGLEIRAVATSTASENMARELGIGVVSFAEIDEVDVTIDGADEVDRNLNLIKGGGGALVREKVVGAATKLYIIIADESKFVDTLGRFPLPVEVILFGWEMTVKKLKKLGCSPRVRSSDNKAIITDNGNYVVDCFFEEIKEPAVLNQQINSIPGVLDNGLFLNMANIVVLGKNDGTTEILRK
jgi:ribose 5-phosphate isomerase A